MIHGTDGKQLSKRRDTAAVGDREYKRILRTAMTNSGNGRTERADAMGTTSITLGQ